MNCQYKFKSGKKKGTECSKVNCKTKTHNKTVELKEPIKKEISEISLMDFGKMIKNELEYLHLNKLPINFINLKEETSDKEVFDTLDIPREVQYYILYRYKLLNNHDLSEVERVIIPLNKFEEMDNILLGKDKFVFLDIFGFIKQQL